MTSVRIPIDESTPLSNSHESDRDGGWRGAIGRRKVAVAAVFGLVTVCAVVRRGRGLPRAAAPANGQPPAASEAAVAHIPDSGTVMTPLSTVDPADAHCPHTDRSEDTKPTAAWGALLHRSTDLRTSLPTNAWWENIVLGNPSQERPENSLAALPYTFDVAGDTPGLRVHFPRVVAFDLIVETQFDWRHAMQLGCAEPVGGHTVSHPGPLAVTLEWRREGEPRGDGDEKAAPPIMRAPVVRGSPYATMEYRGASPVLSSRQEVTQLKVDGKEVQCGNSTLLHVQREVEVVFAGYVSSDSTWLVFVSEPTDFSCSSYYARERGDPPTPGALGAWQMMPRFYLTATQPMPAGVVRTALANNCTTGISPVNCDRGQPRDNSAYARLLREHAELYPTGHARVTYASSHLSWIQRALDGDADQRASELQGVEDQESPLAGLYGSEDPSIRAAQERNDVVGTLRFFWAPARMDGKPVDLDGGGAGTEKAKPVLMFALRHHLEALPQEAMTALRTQTLHGYAELVIANIWEMSSDLPPVSFGVGRPVRPEMSDDVNAALDFDVNYQIPGHFLRGEGDTYFSGKMLAKMARIALVAEEMGRIEDAQMVAARLADAAQVWLNGTAVAKLLYDVAWGGVVSCGCNYKSEHGCLNDAANGDCPGLSDPGMNFGAGFYNDHHFHYGYHIYAAAVAAKFFPEWGIRNHDAVMLLVRDIANPSPDDPFFPLFRHKDWYLGSSWALGIPTLGGVPYANGRNQESSSEAVQAYDAVALYGHVMAQVFAQAGNAEAANVASLVRDTGRQLCATEVRAAEVYWHVTVPDSPGEPRVYPDNYRPGVVGMLWSTLAQMQTWFGAEPWKVYGIQLLPITAVSERLLARRWIKQILPAYEKSCFTPDGACRDQGWSMLVHSAQAIAGKWQEAREGVLALNQSAFESAGGNGHSRTSILWFIATRPHRAEVEAKKEEGEAQAEEAEGVR